MSTIPPVPTGARVCFCDVLHAELDEIARSRKGTQQPIPAAGATQSSGGSRESLAGIQLPHVKPQDGKTDHLWRAQESELLGLAFSGGGIRSATFNLGILQGLAKYSLLPRFDYLSTVSGGGYIGSWFTAWIKRKGLQTVQKELARDVPVPRSPEPREVNFLRQYSNYLRPKPGAFSADTWTIVSIYLRNLLLNLTILVCALGAAVVLVNLLSHLTASLPKTETAFWLPALVGIVALVFAASCLGKNIQILAQDCPRERYPAETYQGAVQKQVVVPILIAAWALTSAAISAPSGRRGDLLLGVALVAGLLYLRLYLMGRKQQPGDPPQEPFLLNSLLAAVTGGAVTGGALYFLFPHLRSGFADWAPAPGVEFIWGIPLVLALLLIGGTFYIGLMGNALSTQHQEWWARLGAWLSIYSLGWIAVSWVTLTGPWIVSQINWWRIDLWGTGFAGWLGTTISGLLAGEGLAADKRVSNRGLELLAGLAPVVFVVGLLVSLVVVAATVASILEWMAMRSGYVEIGLYLTALTAFLMVAAVFSRTVDSNGSSIDQLYRNRLVRCYLGASNDHLNPHPFTGLDLSEHYLRVSDLQCNQPADPPQGLRPKEALSKASYVGPYFLINTAMNLVSGKNLAWQQRMAASFVFAPKHAGFAFLLPGPNQLVAVEAFRPTDQYIDGVSLGTAAAISGTATIPMGHHASGAFTFLMSVFNARPGWWLGNPMKERWDQPNPPFVTYLLMELFGLTNEDSEFVYLSDGGHFENLGIYELVRRRCRFIIACDVGADPDLQFADLGNAIQKCRTDFGIDIEIDVDVIRRSKETGASVAHCAVGAIRYDRISSDSSPTAAGTLLYIKASLTGDEDPDVTYYAAAHPTFPHEPTGDQFGASRFECYRMLGQHIAKTVFEPIEAQAPITTMPNEEIFLRLRQAWYPRNKAVAEDFTKTALGD